MAAATGVAFTSEETVSFATRAVSLTGSAFFSGAPAGFKASVSIWQTISPMAKVSPSFAICFTAPACSALISKVAFSLSNSAITSSRSAHSPSAFNHLTSVTSLMLSPTVGTFISIAIVNQKFIPCEFRLKKRF